MTPDTDNAATTIDTPHIQTLLQRHEATTRPRLETLWSFYRNPMTTAPSDTARGTAQRSTRVRLAQERGLPERLTGPRDAASDDRLPSSREIVIENDIAWRIHTMVDFMFGRPVSIVSTARDGQLRSRINALLDSVWQDSGGVALLADIGLLGHVYGHVDLLVRADEVGRIRVEPIEPTRGIAILDPDDYRRIQAYAIRSSRVHIADARPATSNLPPRGLTRWLAGPLSPRLFGSREQGPIITELFTADARRTFIQDKPDAAARLIDESPALVRAGDDADALGAPPIAHIQNISQPFRYEGLSEVEPLIPLQNELNTRLSDRASRVTLQAFKMYLAKGLDGISNMSVGPGQVWCTDNPAATIEAFGGDATSPSEDAHINEIREALDKASGVPPLASGVVRAKIGNLTSENALRVTLMGLLSKTARKRVTYGRGLAEVSRLILLAAHRAGILSTEPAHRGVRIEWPDPLPRPESDALDAALKKIALGIPRERVLSELGYAPTDPGIV